MWRNGSAAASKTAGCGFDSCHPCGAPPASAGECAWRDLITQKWTYNAVVAQTREVRAAYQRAYYARNRERLQAEYLANREERLAYQKKKRKVYHERLKREVFAAYGNCCACCGEDHPRFLSIDHVNGGGGAHRRTVGTTAMVMLDIIKHGFPADYQLLCFNCNLGRYFNGGTCPHKEAQRALSRSGTP
jgi:hypothetical protein